MPPHRVSTLEPLVPPGLHASTSRQAPRSPRTLINRAPCYADGTGAGGARGGSHGGDTALSTSRQSSHNRRHCSTRGACIMRQRHAGDDHRPGSHSLFRQCPVGLLPRRAHLLARRLLAVPVQLRAPKRRLPVRTGVLAERSLPCRRHLRRGHGLQQGAILRQRGRLSTARLLRGRWRLPRRWDLLRRERQLSADRRMRRPARLCRGRDLHERSSLPRRGRMRHGPGLSTGS